jgi:hypothetical protein
MSRLAPRLLEYYYSLLSASNNRKKLFTGTLLNLDPADSANLSERAGEDVTAQAQNGYISAEVDCRHFDTTP